MNTYLRKITSTLLIGLSLVLCMSLSQALAEKPLSARLVLVIKKLEKKEPDFAMELKKLSEESPEARVALEAHIAEGGTAEMLTSLWKWGDILVSAFNNTKLDFNAFKKKWPQIVKHGRLFCAIADEDGKKHLISSALNDNPGDPGVSLLPLHTYGLKGEDAAIYINEDNEPDTWSIEVEKGREHLVLVQRYPGNNETMIQKTSVQKLQVNRNSGIEVVSDKIESARWEPEWLHDKENSSKNPADNGSTPSPLPHTPPHSVGSGAKEGRPVGDPGGP